MFSFIVCQSVQGTAWYYGWSDSKAKQSPKQSPQPNRKSIAVNQNSCRLLSLFSITVLCPDIESCLIVTSLFEIFLKHSILHYPQPSLTSCLFLFYECHHCPYSSKAWNLPVGYRPDIPKSSFFVLCHHCKYQVCLSSSGISVEQIIYHC